MNDIETKDRAWYITQLMSEECHCGAPKQPRYSFCYHCYSALPKSMQSALYDLVDFGYQEAYEKAVQWLDENIL